ncbi:LysR family transcriptional regulator, transcriptional activator of the cysJI operon [Gammaproteobacteria bacterium]
MADRRLQVFHTVARLLSFTKAADALHMTQPAVTFQVRQLEEHFNVRLFDRTHNKISLTPAGEVVYLHAERIFEHYREMENNVRALTEEISGLLAIGASTTVAEYMLPMLLGDFKLKYPNVTVRLKVSNTENIVSMVENHLVDLGIVEANVSNQNIAVEICGRDELVVIMKPNHELSKYSSIQAKDLCQYPYICREEGSGTLSVISEYLNTLGMSLSDLQVVMELGSPESIKGAVEAGMGLSIVSKTTIQKELRLRTLIAIPLFPTLSRPFSFIHQRLKFRMRAIDELIEFSRQYCKNRMYKNLPFEEISSICELSAKQKI